MTENVGRDAMRRAWYSALCWAAAHDGYGLADGMQAFNDWHDQYEAMRKSAKELTDKVGPAKTIRHDQGRY